VVGLVASGASATMESQPFFLDVFFLKFSIRKEFPSFGDVEKISKKFLTGWFYNFTNKNINF
jgi:hypothetical protein